MTKYKGIDKEKILKIQEVHMPKFAVPDIDEILSSIVIIPLEDKLNVNVFVRVLLILRLILSQMH